MFRARVLVAACAALWITTIATPSAHAFQVVFGDSWDGISLQSILDAEYGAGALNAQTDYEGYHPGDADPPYWVDEGLDGVIIREIAGYQDTNTMGWYEETFTKPSIDGIGDGVIFTGPRSMGYTVALTFPAGVTRFGFYLNPNGNGDSTNAPEPEMFFTNRSYNDEGPSGSGALHAPSGGDPQCLIYNVTHLRGGVPTFVLAWEDLDSGSALSPTYSPTTTDNDFQDLVVEISAASPVKVSNHSWGQVKALFDASN